MYVLLLPTGMEVLKIVAIWSLVPCGLFLVIQSLYGPVSNDWNTVVLLFWFGSYEQPRIIHARIDDRQFVWYCFYVRSKILKCITRTKTLSKFQIISSLPAVKICACLSELPGTECEGSVVPINGAAWSVICKTRWRTVLLWLHYFLFWSKKVIMV